MLRSSGPCVSCGKYDQCPLLAPPSSNSSSLPIPGPVCISGSSPCTLGGPVVGSASGVLCLSGSSSPFGNVLDLQVQCGANGTSTVWSLCAGVQYAGCGGCSCTCRQDLQLTAYANNLATSLTTNGFCFPPSTLPQSINPLSLLVTCRTC
jgi:hypothetical protein